MLKEKCAKALDVIKVVANSKWGADKISLLHFYRSLVRSKLDYGSIVCRSARTSYLKALDAMHHRSLRLCLGAFEHLQSTVCMSRQMNHLLIYADLNLNCSTL